VSQYIRDHWGPDKGFPSGPVYAITQTTDGYLWIGTEAGLVRFDGLTFQLIQSGRTTRFSLEQPLGQSLGVAADDSGDLWIRLRGPALLGYRSGNFFEPPLDLQQSRAGVTVATRGRNGELIFATRRNGLFALRQANLKNSRRRNRCRCPP
jgi:ligand-binding sensor domain-containing protein